MIRALARGAPERLEVAVHSDSKGVAAHNLKLTLDRAARMHAALTHAFPLAEIRAVGGGDRNPVGDNATIEGRTSNRRIELTVYRRG
jgi:type VI secretion system protein ImpK